jgi:hypothetical protein
VYFALCVLSDTPLERGLRLEIGITVGAPNKNPNHPAPKTKKMKAPTNKQIAVSKQADINTIAAIGSAGGGRNGIGSRTTVSLQDVR